MQSTEKDDLDNIIDPAWLEEQERLQQVNSVLLREPMNQIEAKFFYINTKSYIDKITCKSIPLEINEKCSFLSKEVLIRTIDNNKIKNKNSRYKLLDVFLCNFDILPNMVHSFSKNSNDSFNSKNYMKKINPINDLIIYPSTFLFHSLNGLFFFFEEEELEDDSMFIPKSILKQRTELRDREPKDQSNKKSTKKVRIFIKDESGSQRLKKNTTKKFKHLSQTI